MPEMHLRQPGFTCCACGPLTNNKEKIQKFKETGYLRYIYQNELDKACSQHDMAYGDFKDLPRRTASDKASRNKPFNIAKKPEYDGSQCGLASVVFKFLDKMLEGGAVTQDILSNQRHFGLAMRQLVNELHKPFIKKFEKRKVYSSFKTNTWCAALVDMQLVNI